MYYKDMKCKHNKEELEAIVNKSFGYAECLRQLGLREAGGNYSTIKKYIKLYGISTEHFCLQGWSKGKTVGPKTPTEDYLSNKKPVASNQLKIRLIKEGVFKKQCDKCKRIEWEGLPIPLELHHKNGDRLNNSLDNLCLLCPNCHATTDNYRGKNKKANKPDGRKKKSAGREKRLVLKEETLCLHCSVQTKNKTKFCSSLCANSHNPDGSRWKRKVENRPDECTLLKLLEDNSFEAVGRMFNVTGNAIRKWLKQYKKNR